MTGYRSSSIDELPTLWDGFAKLVRAGLAIDAFGANIMDLPPDYATKWHDEAESEQQELYVALRGSGAVVVGDERIALDADHLVCVDAGTRRVVTSGSDGLRVLCVGGVPGGIYEPPQWSSGEGCPAEPGRHMGERYHEGSRELQDLFDTRRLADRIDERTGRDHIEPEDRAFIERMDMFFLATSDLGGQPQCSYKGGAPGFVHVLDEHTLAFPNYDGNGMFLSWGNALVNPQVGLLFVDFVAERPTRLRVEGTASVRHGDELLADWPEAQFVVRVQATRVFPNCPRYIHRMALVERSSYVPRAGIVTPVPDWKRGELATGVLPKGDPAAQLDEPAQLAREPSDDQLGG